MRCKYHQKKGQCRYGCNPTRQLFFCHKWQRDGFCEFEKDCKYLHDNPQPAVAAKKMPAKKRGRNRSRTPRSRAPALGCKYIESDGFCSYGCDTTQRRFFCHKWGRAGVCINGQECKYLHGQILNSRTSKSAGSTTESYEKAVRERMHEEKLIDMRLQKEATRRQYPEDEWRRWVQSKDVLIEDLKDIESDMKKYRIKRAFEKCNLAENVLRSLFLNMQRAFHPDKYKGKDAVEISAFINSMSTFCTA